MPSGPADLVDSGSGAVNRRSLVSRRGHRIDLLDADGKTEGVTRRHHRRQAAGQPGPHRDPDHRARRRQGADRGHPGHHHRRGRARRWSSRAAQISLKATGGVTVDGGGGRGLGQVGQPAQPWTAAGWPPSRPAWSRSTEAEGAAMNIDFIGAGWSFPLGTDATGGVALVTREREIEQAIRLILGTACGERPMRPEFGCRIHDHVFGPATSATAGADRLRRPRGSGAVGAADRGGRRGGELRRHRVRAPSTSTSATPSAGLNDPRNLVFPFYVIPDDGSPRAGAATRSPGRADRHAARPQPGRPTLPGPRRRRQAPGPAALPGVDRPQRVRPRRHADRGVRPDGRPADLPAQPGARPALREVPRADRRRAAAAGRGPRCGHLLAVGAPAADGAWSGPRPRWPPRVPTSTSRSCSAPPGT